MKMYTIKCTLGYQLPGESGAFTANSKLTTGVNRIQRERLGRAADAAHVQVMTDVPNSMSALSSVRRT